MSVLANRPNLKNGEIVKWYENYPYGLCKDAGLGIIMRTENIKNIILFWVWRFDPHNDFMRFPPSDLEEIKGEKNDD